MALLCEGHFLCILSSIDFYPALGRCKGRGKGDEGTDGPFCIIAASSGEQT